MTTLIEGAVVLRSDARNRVHTPRERREALLDEFERGSLNGAQFAELTGIKYQTFAGWLQKRRRQQGSSQAEAPARAGDGVVGVRWVEAVAGRRSDSQDSMAAKGFLRVELPGGASVEISHRSQLMMTAELLRTVAASCSL